MRISYYRDLSLDGTKIMKYGWGSTMIGHDQSFQNPFQFFIYPINPALCSIDIEIAVK
jgi:hypothetical protein